MIGSQRCHRHRAARAGWSCQGCGKALCPDCAYTRVAGATTLTACSLCGGMALPLTVHRAQAASLSSRLPRALGYPLSLQGVATLAAVALVMTGLSWFGLLGAFFARGVYWAFLFSLIRTSARGSADLEVADFSDPLSDLIVPALRGLAATAILWVPAVLYLASAHGRDVLADPAGVAADPVLWLIVAASVVYVPMAVMMAAMGGGFLQMLNPVAAFAFMARLGADYAIAVGAIVVLSLADLGVGLVAGAVGRTGVPLLSGWAATLLGLYFPAVMARVLGLLLHVRGDSLGVGVPQEYQEPVLPGAEPRGSPAAASAAPQVPPAPATAAFAAAVPPGPAADRKLDAQRAPGPPAAGVVDSVDLRAEIARAATSNDLARAAALYAASSLGARDLAAQVHYQVARGAAAAKDYPLAVRALRAAAARADDPVAPAALLVLGRIYGRKLADPASARRVLEHLLAHYPDSDAAGQARADLAAPS